MNGVELDNIIHLQDRILHALRKTIPDRKRATHSTVWITNERQAMCEAANTWALAYGLATITVDDIERIEGLALGHVDYMSKISLYVAELVYGVRT